MYDRSVEFIPVLMETHQASQYPHYTLPTGYTLSGYRDGFERDWGRIEMAAFDAGTVEQNAEKFLSVFGQKLSKARTNCLFVLDPTGLPVATGSLWMGPMNGKQTSRLHYIATDPAHGGKGLCKALLTAIFDLQQAQGLGEYIYLTSQTPSYPAISLYEHFGFRPYFGPCPEVWQDYPDYAEKNPRAWEIIRAKQQEYAGSHSKG